MKFSLILKLAAKNLIAMKRVIIPFIISVSIMFGIQYIMLSLIGNDYIQERHSSLPSLMSFANVMTGILTLIFVIYANRFVMKQRQQEFGLNMVLGMEKKHLRMILFFEAAAQFIIIAVISTAGGFLFGSLMFMSLNRFVQESGISLMKYPFDFNAMVTMLLMLFGIMLLLFIINNMKISMQNPVALLQSQKAGEKKTNKVLLVIIFLFGSVFLIYGYYLALTTEGVIDSLQTIFLAGLSVLVGTYLLFISLTIIVLQLLKNISSFYYKPNNFLSISGMLYRMRNNAVSLASIAMLITLLTVTLGMTTTAYRGIEQQVENTINHDYALSVADYSEDEESELDVIDNLMMDISNVAEVEEFNIAETTFVPAYNDEGNLQPLTDNAEQDEANKSTYVYFINLEGHNSLNDENLKLGENEVGYSSNAERFSGYENLSIDDQSYEIVVLEEDYLGASVGIDALYVVVPDVTMLQDIANSFKKLDFSTGEYHSSEIMTNMEFNVINDIDETTDELFSVTENYNVELTSKEAISEGLYELNGGLIFMGMIVSVVLMIGTFLILYYKQISEGQEDQKNFQIMKKVGLPEHLIKTTIRKQISWVFILPLLVAVIHTLFASGIIYDLLGMIGVRNEALFVTSYIGVLIIILILYSLMYLITSRVYYNIVNR